VTTTTWYAHERDRSWTCDGPSPEALAFHRSLPGYAPTPLVALPTLAVELGVGQVLAKDESSRLGLPAFKALGASWAIHRALRDRTDPGPVTVVTATDGNHGRAVARFARLLGHRASVWIPDGVHPEAVQAIADEGAQVTVVGGSYDDAVAAAARAAAADSAVLVQDTAWEGYEQVPGWIVEGYSTLFAEVDSQLDDAGLTAPDLIVVPVGVGSLLQAALAHYRRPATTSHTAVVSVEPEVAACIAPSLAAGRPVTVETGPTVMAGLNCGTPSSLAWPFVARGLDAAVAVTDADDVRAAHDLAALGVAAGPCGAAGLAALRLVLLGVGNEDRRAHLRLQADSVVVLVVTEGAAANPVPDLEDS
jgi:diaminopropionate ammonia-lyase